MDYNGSPAGYADQPDEVITYVDAHDNETLWDALTYKLPRATPMADRIRMNTLSLATTALSQTPSFWHAGADLLRSKSLDRNSYDSGDWFNTLDWTGEDNGFGHGLPPAPDNEAKWPFQQPLLADPALKPTPAEVQGAVGPGAGPAPAALLDARCSGSARPTLIKQKVTFPVSGTAAARDRGDRDADRRHRRADVDPALRGAWWCSTPRRPRSRRRCPAWPGPAGALAGAGRRLRPGGEDRRPGTRGSITIPGRTVAVFEQAR